MNTAACIFFCSLFAASVSSQSAVDHGEALTKWLISHKGRMHESLEFQSQGPYFGMFATQKIKKDEVLLQIPGSLVLSPARIDKKITKGDRVSVYFAEHKDWFPGDVMRTNEIFDGGESITIMDVMFDDGDFFSINTGKRHWEKLYDQDCATVRRVLDENALGSDSIVAPYIAYLNSQPRGQVPAAWTSAGNDLFREVLGLVHGTKKINPYTLHDVSSKTILPPQWDEGRFDGLEFLKRCKRLLKEGEEEDALNYYHLLNQRGWDELMIPVFDMMSHGNGPLLNTYHDTVRNPANDNNVAKTIKVYASRDIAVGEEITTTYNFCEDCENRFMGYGTPELLRDYGFVEGFPQRWFFHDQDIAFQLDQPDGPGTSVAVEWLLEKPSADMLDWLAKQRTRLTTLSNTVLKDETAVDGFVYGMPQYEFETLQRYQQALIIAIEECLKSAGIEIEEDCEKSDSQQCQSSLDAYEDFEFSHPNDEFWENDRPMACAEGPDGETHPYHMNEQRPLKVIQSPYQEIYFYQNMDRNNDTCFQLDGVTQICTSYRPDYHEVIVHNTARYLEEPLKRVIFVGGGDSMLLYDVIKYSTLEKVVGLEIDQHVTRASFEFFGTEPHWDDPRVEWWFGDASKSLLMLPQDYFGSFDLVLVDLSETAASLSVTDHLNVMEALSLLLKPKGILVKNEYNYFPEQVSRASPISHTAHDTPHLKKQVFRDSLHIHYYNVTSVCSQSIILGSNGIDFMRGSYEDSGEIEYQYKKLLEDPLMHYGYLHDYQKNYTNPIEFCTTDVKDENVQETSPGVFMIIEAEDTKVDLSVLDTVKSLVEAALISAGFTVAKSITPTSTVATFILHEGYVIARTYAEHNYVGFDFLLWSSFDKQEAGKKALIEAMGSDFFGKSSSSYRVVTGGMFGVSGWKDDEKRRGPKLKNCDEIEEVGLPKKYDQVETMDGVRIAVQESMGVVKDAPDGVDVVLLCGSGELCETESALEDVANVVTLRACAETDGYEFSPNGGRIMADCELEMHNTMREYVSKTNRKFRAVVLDPTATEALAKLMIKIMLSPANKRLYFAENMAVAVPLIDLSESWRRTFADRFRTHLFPEDPTHRAELYFNSTTASFMVAVGNSGDFNFAEALVEFVNKTEARTQMTGEIENIRGNTFPAFIVTDPHYVPENFTDSDFDQEGQLKHWQSQLPLGFQVIFQFDVSEKGAKTMDLDAAKEMFENALTLKIVETGDELQMKIFDQVGDGFLIMTFWSGGTAALVYDGRRHIDASVFTYVEDSKSVYAFDEAFTGCSSSDKACKSGITRTLRDTQPRGKGRVVSFMGDLDGFGPSGKPRKIPLWAPKDKQALPSSKQ